MTVFLQLTVVGSDTGPFDLYSNFDYDVPFETGVTKADLELGYITEVPDYAIVIRVTSTGDCINSTDIILSDTDCILDGYVEEITTTTTTSSTTAAPVITTVTEINIWFDNSGSMDTTLAPLNTMRDTLLKDCIGPIYGYDPLVPGSDALYNTRVKVFNFSDYPSGYERFVALLSQGKNFLRTTDNTVNQVLNLTFADESDSYGYGGSGAFNNTTRTAQYDTDITLLRNQAVAISYIKGIAFRVNTGPNAFPGFRGLTQATFVNTGVYVPPFNVSDYSDRFFCELDVIAASTPTYYLSKVVAGLNTLGFTLTC